MNWGKVKLGKLCKLTNGKAFKPSDWSTEGLPIIRIQNLNDYSKPFNYWSGSIKKQVLIKSGDVLLAWSGTPGTSFGAHIWERGESVLNQHIFKLDLDNSIITKKWMVFAINYQLQKLIFQAHGGVGLKHVTKRMVENLDLPLPSILEQKRIASILDKADAIRRKRQQAIQLADDFLRSVFWEMFGDPVVNPKKWNKIPLNQLIVGGPQNGLYKPSKAYGSGTQILRIDSFYDGKIVDLNRLKRVEIDTETINKFKLHVDDIVINRVNSRKFLGKSALIEELNETTVFESNMMRFSVKKKRISPKYLVTLLQQRYIRNQILNFSKDAVNQSSINQNDVKKFTILLPPLKHQKRYVKLVKHLEKFKKSQEAALCHNAKLFNSLSQRAFRGEL